MRAEPANLRQASRPTARSYESEFGFASLYLELAGQPWLAQPASHPRPANNFRFSRAWARLIRVRPPP